MPMMNAERDTGMHDPSPSLLADLLRRLFDADELRRHLAREPGGAGLLAALPGPGVSLDALAYESAEALKRRNLVGRDFFERLEAARPGRREAIRLVRDAWLARLQLEAGALWGGRYRLEAQIGNGGFACVWRAIDEQTGQLVALKILHNVHLDNPRVRQRFFRGAQTLAGLSHPAIVRVHAAALEVGQHSFYVMEYVRGVTLEVCVRERRCAQSELLAMALQIGDALSHVHQRGLLHRDVKPSNILVTDRKLARLIDFDLVTGGEFVALTVEAVGTRLYMPPEAHTSDLKTPAYDVFSLARTIEFILRGREPTVRELDDVADINAPAEVKAILRAALQPDPQRRIADMATFCVALRAALPRADPGQRRPKRDRPPTDDETFTRKPLRPGWITAVASISGHLMVTTYLGHPFEKSLIILLLFVAPSVRVLLDRERNRYLTILHWTWVALWGFFALLFIAALFDPSPATNFKPFPTVLILGAIGLGIHASVVHLRRLRAM